MGSGFTGILPTSSDFPESLKGALVMDKVKCPIVGFEDGRGGGLALGNSVDDEDETGAEDEIIDAKGGGEKPFRLKSHEAEETMGGGAVLFGDPA